MKQDRYRPGDVIYYHELVRDLTEPFSASGISAMRRTVRGVPGEASPRVMVFNADACLLRKLRLSSNRSVGEDSTGRNFLPWCLKQSAEAAAFLSIDLIIVECSDASWIQLAPIRRWLPSVFGVTLRHRETKRTVVRGSDAKVRGTLTKPGSRCLVVNDRSGVVVGNDPRSNRQPRSSNSGQGRSISPV